MKNLMIMLLGVHVLLLCSCASVSASDRGKMPEELLGIWKYGYAKCSTSAFGEGDSVIKIESTEVIGYENRDVIKSVDRISASPGAWRILRISDIAPADVQGQHEIFVTNGARMTITDGESARVYTRCK